MKNELKTKLQNFSTNNVTPRTRITTDCSSPILTEQSHANSVDINYIVAQFKKTGMMPQTLKTPQYLDNTDQPTLIDAFYAVQDAHTAFLNLPAKVRALMGNNPANLENFIADSENHDILLKHGVLIKNDKQTDKDAQPPKGVPNEPAKNPLPPSDNSGKTST